MKPFPAYCSQKIHVMCDFALIVFFRRQLTLLYGITECLVLF